MTISYKWLCNYLPVSPTPEELSSILTSIGLEVENLEKYEEVKGGLKGLLIGEVIACEKHPNADKLSLTKVNTGNDNILSIVCGAPNVAKGQKVVVAPVGATIYPAKGEPLTMKLVKIRGEESQGMICAGDEIGISEDHSGILVLDAAAQTGTPASDYFNLYEDWIYEIGLTPNRMDAMSHWGVARDVCAYLSHHQGKNYRANLPEASMPVYDNSHPIKVRIEDTTACQRYCGVSIKDVQVKESPDWLKKQLKAIGLRPINNIVDITNYILHETGQPLHAFDASAIRSNEVVVKTLPADSSFVTLDGKEIKLSADDLMICNGEGEAMCIGGVYGGLHSGVRESTQVIFLESAWFHPVSIRKTSFRHGLRTDAAMRFEKNTNIDMTDRVLARAAAMICEMAGGKIASEIVDVYPAPAPRKVISFPLAYLSRLSGKQYPKDSVKNILQNLGFAIKKETGDLLEVEVPFSKPDVHLPADVVEEIMRIDGLDHISIPSHITLSPSHEESGHKQRWYEKTASFLSNNGFNEICTNSITNVQYLDPKELDRSVRLLNNLSAEHNVMRPSMLYTGLECIAHNINRKNTDLLLYEFGKTYLFQGPGKYEESDRLCLYTTGNRQEAGWRSKAAAADLFYLKGVIQSLSLQMGISQVKFTPGKASHLQTVLEIEFGGVSAGVIGQVSTALLKKSGIKQSVYFADLKWAEILEVLRSMKIKASPLPRQMPVSRDLAMILPAEMPYSEVEKSVKKRGLDKLQHIQLFDIFENDRFGAGKKSVAISITFLDPEKTLTDKEIDQMMGSIMDGLEKEIRAEIRKQ
jgi:phenylalanyl-tRNA synthetase beta chain